MKKIIPFFALFIVACFMLNTWAQTDQGVFTKTLINSGDYNSKWWRIPAIETAADGSLVAVFDKRFYHRDDLPYPITLVSMRSTDKGRTWSEPTVIAAHGNGHTYGDAALVLDTVTNELICVYVGDQGFFQSTPGNRAVIYYSKSSDNGQSWSAPTSINNFIYTDSRSNWKAAFAGSGGGLQMKNGRLMFVLCVRPNNDNGDGYVDNWTLYSDDHGATWNVSSNRATDVGNEAKVVELTNGDILMSIRNHAKGMRMFCKSEDSGVTWGTSYLSETLKDADCNGDILRTVYNGKSYLLHSLPNSSTQRRDVSVFVSDDEGETWNHHKQLVNGYAAYSSLTVLEDGTIGCLIEEGHDGTFGTDSSFNIVFHNFSMEWLLEGMGESNGEEATGTLVCNGTDRYMSIADHDDFDMPAIANNRYTISLRVLKDAQTNIGERFVGKRANEGNGWEVWGVYNKDGYDFDFAVNTTPSYTLPGSANDNFTYGEWNHVCWVFDGPSKKSYYYINGVKVNEKDITNNSTNTTSLFNDLDVLVGCGYDFHSTNASWFFDGEIDDVHFYKSVLTAAQVATDMNSFDVATAQGLNLVAAYDFANITGTSVPDISGNGHTGTLHGYSIAGPEEKYKTPEGNMHSNGETYVERIYTEGANKNIDKSWTTTPDNVYQLLDEAVEVEQGSSFNLYLNAHSLGSESSTTVRQDLRYTTAVVFSDWDSNGSFSQEQVYGTNPPAHNVTGNMAVMAINQSFNVPTDAALGDTRIRVIYSNAWGAVSTANSITIQDGMAYDIPVKVIPAASAIHQIANDNTTLYYNNGTIYSNGEGEIAVYDLAGKLVKRASVTATTVDDLAHGTYIAKANGKALKFVK